MAGYSITTACMGRYLISYLTVLALASCKFCASVPVFAFCLLCRPCKHYFLGLRNVSYNNLSGIVPPMRNFSRFSPDRYSREMWLIVCKLSCTLTHLVYICVLALLEIHCCAAIGWDQYAGHMHQNLEVSYRF